MRVLIDTNVVLDFLLDREPFGEDAASLFEKIVSVPEDFDDWSNRFPDITTDK